MTLHPDDPFPDTVVPSRNTTWDRGTLLNRVQLEFEDWALPRCSSPLPKSWTVLARATATASTGSGVTLFAHHEGGVHVIYTTDSCTEQECVVPPRPRVHEPKSCVRLGFVYLSLKDLHQDLADTAVRNPMLTLSLLSLQAATAAVTRLYDQRDPAEAAEAMLVAMGAPVTRYPACLD